MLEFTKFGGANVALHPLLLPVGVGVDVRNFTPKRGDFRPLKAPGTVYTLPLTTAQSIYRMGRTAPNDTNYWLAWASNDVDVARGFIAEDPTERTFWSGDGGPPKWTNNIIGLASSPYPTAAGVRLLGVPKPNADPTVVETVPGAGSDQDIAYVTVWVNDLGEISMPSGAVPITTKPGATVQITRNATVPAGAYGLTAWRIYRTIVGNEQDYFFVTEQPVATTVYNDTGAVNTSDVLPSEEWAEPPANLRGLKALWNGMMVGFIGKAVCFSEPFYPFAWPVRYQIPLDADIIGLGRMGLSLVVLTVDQPYVLTGSSPEAMSTQLVEFNQSCVAKRGIGEHGNGVSWPSPDGLCFLGIDGSRRVLTANIATREDWQAFVPSTLIAGVNEGVYTGSYLVSGTRKVFELDPAAPDQGFIFHDIGFVACYRDPIADAFYILQPGSTGNIQRWDYGAPMTALHKSRIERVAAPTNFGYAQVIADSYPVTLTIWSGGSPILTNYAVPSADGFRLPDPGFTSDQWQGEIKTTGPAVQGFALAHSAEELRRF